MMRLVLASLLAAGTFLYLAATGNPAGPAAADSSTFLIEPVVWQLTTDYVGGAEDSALPIDTVYVKTHDGTDWMSTYDNHPNAISGQDALKRTVELYRSQGIDVIAWFVPKGTNIEAQLMFAMVVIDSGVKALYADVEPYAGFCYTECPFLAREFWHRLRQLRPNAELGVIYDPRPAHWAESGIQNWLSVANTALPMCYWPAFVDQPPWSDPAGCVSQARTDLRETIAPGVPLQYVPMLDAHSDPGHLAIALQWSDDLGADRVSLWRRGTTPDSTWATVAAYRAKANAEREAAARAAIVEAEARRLSEDPCFLADQRLGRKGGLC